MNPNKEALLRPYRIELPKIPTGEKLMGMAIETAAKALEACYPSLGNKYSKRACIDLEVHDFEEIQRKRISEIPTQKTAAEKSLLKSKILKTSIHKERSKEDKFLYWNPNATNIMYISNIFLEVFNSDNQSERLESAINFGQLFISETIQSLPIPQELHDEEKTYWRETAIHQLHSFIEELKKGKNPTIDPEKLEKLQMNTELFTLNSPQAQFLAYGAEVRILLPGQNIMYPSYSVGELFNAGIVGVLTQDAQLKYVSLLKKQYPSFKVNGKLNKSKTQQFAEEILNNFKFEDKNTLFEAFVSSQIPSAIFRLRK